MVTIANLQKRQRPPPEPCSTRACASQVLLRVIKPYTRIRLSFISSELNIAQGEVEELA